MARRTTSMADRIVEYLMDAPLDAAEGLLNLGVIVLRKRRERVAQEEAERKAAADAKVPIAPGPHAVATPKRRGRKPGPKPRADRIETGGTASGQPALAPTQVENAGAPPVVRRRRRPDVAAVADVPIPPTIATANTELPDQMVDRSAEA